MIKQIAALVAITVGLNWNGLARAEITSECSLSGSGDYLCTFSNKGNKKDSVCIHMIFGADNPSYLGFTAAGGSAKYRDYTLQEAKRLTEKGNNSLNPSNGFFEIAKQQLEHSREASAEIVTVEEETPRVSAFYLASIKKAAKKPGMSIDQYVKNNLPTLTVLILATESKGISNEICSGIIDASDLRERRGLARFSGAALPREGELSKYGKEYASLKQLQEKVAVIEQESPAKVCLSGDAPWDSVCNFSTLSTVNLTTYLKKAIMSAPDKLPKPVEKMTEGK